VKSGKIPAIVRSLSDDGKLPNLEPEEQSVNTMGGATSKHWRERGTAPSHGRAHNEQRKKSKTMRRTSANVAACSRELAQLKIDQN